MKIVYGKNLTTEEMAMANAISRECDILFDTARLLLYRGIDTPEKAKRFLSAGKHGFIDPFLLSGMVDAVERIKSAKENDENVLIFGDYDADGVSATTVLYYSLKKYGITNLSKYVPEREEGYGINIDTIKRHQATSPIDLLITVDCGISDREKIEELKSMGIDVIVTDHHEPPEDLPDCIKINPKLPNQAYSFNGLCGAGVAYKLSSALIGDLADEYLDFVALATVADSMDLVSENRDIVVEGLKLFNNPKTQKLPFKYILGDKIKTVTSQTLAYNVAPRINAGGRMDDANCALQLFTETDPEKIYALAVKLGEYNTNRQIECDKMFHEAVEKIQKLGLHKRKIILIKEEKWRAGFIGIVAAKLVEVFGRPTIVFAGQGDHLKGSARSVEGLNIHEAISSVKDLLLGYGGHSQAAGLSVEKGKFVALDRALNDLFNKEYGEFDVEPTTYAEWNIEKEISLRFAREIDLLEPFGTGNKRPTFTMEVESVDSLQLKSASAHYSFKALSMEMLDFNGKKNVLPLSYPIKKKILFEVNLSTFKNRENVKGFVRSVCLEYDDLTKMGPLVLENELKKLLLSNSDKKFPTISEEIRSGKGTIYALTNIDLLNKHPELKNLPKFLFMPESKTGQNAVVLSLSAVPDVYNRVIYLEKPSAFIDFAPAKTYLLENATRQQTFDGLSTDRADFARIFGHLTTLSGRRYIGSADFATKHFEEKDQSLAVFVIEVFIELGIFSIYNEMIVFNEKCKNALTNSRLYSKINLLKEEDV